MTVFDYILLGIAFIHFLLTLINLYSIPSFLMHRVSLTNMCNIWWVFPLIVIYRVWG